MKKLILCAAVATACLSPQAFAQSKNFEGPSVGLTANFNNGKTEAPGISISDTSATPGIKAAYGWNLGSNFILSAGLSYDAGNIKMGTSAAGVTVTGKGLTVVSVEPGAKISNDTLVYAKLGYATARGELSGAANGSDNYDGAAFGVGLRNMMGKNWSLDVEAVQINFTAKRSTAAGGDVKPSDTVVSIGVNYHF